ncbi:aminoacyl--tRNA ligase-related protein [Bacillus sp. SM2101]|uniref:aminoacyl--tRNA ligase-related protein n=1 Tax=Bacillus sp. SM2101 TaxID=2805366 RepID=UPI001BDEDC47|nr:aminoacyl--tRNA ligase-related protein [Bacillus sp. SM2101]
MLFNYPISKIKTKDFPDLINRIYLLSTGVTKVSYDYKNLKVIYKGDKQVKFFGDLEKLITQKDRQIKKKVIKDNCDDSEVSGEFIVSKKNEDGISFEGDIAKIYEAVKRLLDQISSKFNATYTKYPTIMSKLLMDKSKYSLHFPQNTYRMSEIKHQKEDLEKYRLLTENSLDTSDLFQATNYYLRPCLCYFAYNDREGEDLEKDLDVISSFGQCFRHENTRQISPFRSRDFNMYEIVYIGGQEKVTELRNKLVEEVWTLFNLLGLKGKIETANDPFFIKNDRSKISYQRAGERKYELVFTPNSKVSFSLASFNLCDDVLTKSFDIKSKNQSAYSGCTAFGIERWVQAIVYTYGTNPVLWPKYILEMMVND